MNPWRPRITVATVVMQDDRYLMVEERDKTSGKLVFNQPAGHLEAGESLVGAALRETLEETGWEVEVTGVLGVSLFSSPEAETTYLRTTFLACAKRCRPGYEIDPDITAVHWLSYDDLLARSARMRSPLVLSDVNRQRRGTLYPLDLLGDP